VLRVIQPHVFPARAAVHAFVDAVAKTDVSAADVFAGANPHDLRIRRIKHDATDRVRFLLVKNRFPGGAGIGGLPNTTRANRHIPGAEIGWMDGDVGDPTRHQCRANAAELEALEGLGGHAFAGIFFLNGRTWNCQRTYDKQDKWLSHETPRFARRTPPPTR
jgi:hypothetical protein